MIQMVMVLGSGSTRGDRDLTLMSQNKSTLASSLSQLLKADGLGLGLGSLGLGLGSWGLVVAT